jgi:hypothetical protein
LRRGDDHDEWHAIETYKGLIQVSIGGLRFSVFSNGGAAVALLAYLGQVQISAEYSSGILWSMFLFAVGVALGGAAHITAYLTQLRLYGESALDEPQQGILRHNNFLYATVGLVSVSILSFLVGALVGAVTLV